VISPSSMSAASLPWRFANRYSLWREGAREFFDKEMANTARSGPEPTEQKLKLLEDLPIAVLLCSKQGEVLTANRAAIHLLGEKLEGKKIGMLMDAEQGQPGTFDELTSLLESNRHSQSTTARISWRLPNGTSRLMLCSCQLQGKAGMVTITVFPEVLQLQGSLTRIAQSLLVNSRPENTLSAITEEALHLCHGDRAYIKLYDAEKQMFAFRALFSIGKEDRFPEEFSEADRGMTGHVYRTRKPYRSGNVHNEPPGLYFPLFEDTVSKVVVPLLSRESTGDETCYGVLAVDGKREDQFDSDCEEILKLLAENAAIGLAQLKLSEEVRTLYTQLLDDGSASGDSVAVRHLLHDSKNAVGLVLYEAETICKDLSETAFGRKRASNLNARLNKLRDLSDLMEAMLDQVAGRPSRSRAGAETGFVDLAGLASRVIRMVPSGNTPIEISLHCEERSYPVKGSATQILLVVYNLVVNAVKAIQRSGRPGKITLSVMEAPDRSGYRRIRIHDTGPGVPRSVLETLREGQRWSGTPGGSGFGLQRVRETVSKILNGNMAIESKYGEFTAVVVDLPIPEEEVS
jgi:nitrogen-specific signal transduction histidine kinase